MKYHKAVLILLFGWCTTSSGCEDPCKVNQAELINLSKSYPYADNFNGQVHRFDFAGKEFVSVRIAGDSTYLSWCSAGRMLWIGFGGYKGGNSLQPINAEDGLFLLDIGSSSTMVRHHSLFLIDVSSGGGEVVLAVPSLLDGLTSWSPAESTRHSVEFEYPELQLREKWRYDREDSHLDSGEQIIALKWDSTTGVLFQKMIYLDRMSLIKGQGQQKSDTVLALMRDVPVVETQLGTTAFIDGNWYWCRLDSSECDRLYRHGDRANAPKSPKMTRWASALMSSAQIVRSLP